VSELPSISLFTGAGGLDIGLEKAGFSPKICVENDKERCNVLGLNRSYWKVASLDIRSVSAAALLRKAGLRRGNVALISGGPPCQPFSKAAFWVPDRFRPYRRDERRSLLNEFARIVVGCRPKAFVFENVAGLAYSTNRRYLDLFRRTMEKSGYTISARILNSADYGVPQKRERLFVIGSKDEVKFDFPKPTHCGDPHKIGHKGLKPHVTAGSAIGHLGNGDASDLEKPGGKWGHLLPKVPPGQNYLFFTKERGHPHPLFKWRSKYWSFLAKLSPSKPSWTIPARPGPYTGPFHWRSRKLRIAEVKRLQTFPASWSISSDPSKARSALGDATPPKEAHILGNAIINQLF
jgi:DNA (cytosine-5)-methyltransferase 1